MKEMVNVIPLGSCPKCGHKQFAVSECQIGQYLTNADGEIIDSFDIDYSAECICINCKSVFKMYSTKEGFIPLTRLREIMFNYTPHFNIVSMQNKILDNITNPMEVNNDL